MKILITSNSHLHYDKVGQIIRKNKDGSYAVQIPNEEGTIRTKVSEGEFKPTKVQE